MKISAEHLKRSSSQEDEGGSHIHGITAIIFLVFGVMLILKLLNLDYIFLQYVPDATLYWIAAVGSTFGGLYMIYKKYIYRHKFILR